MTTENRNYNLPEAGETDWHIPVNENFELIDQDVHEALEAVDNGDGEGADAIGIERRRRNVGPMLDGGYHATEYTDGGYGIVFEAADLHIESVVVEPDLADGETGELVVELRRFEDGATDPTILDSSSHTLSPGPQRIALDFDVPASGSASADENDQYVLQRGYSDELPLRRIHEEEGWTQARFDDHTYTDPEIDFIDGWLNSAESGKDGSRSRWLFFFDWLVGPAVNRVVSPRSTDVEEIYMRPTDPEEEFDDIGPRALWIDTS